MLSDGLDAGDRIVIQPDHGDKQNRSAKRMKCGQAAHSARADGNQAMKRFTQDESDALMIRCCKSFVERPAAQNCRKATEVTTRDDQFGADHSAPE